MKILQSGAMLSVVLAAVCWSQEGVAGEQLVFAMDHTGTSLTSYTLTVHEDGSAVYAASYPAERPKYSPYAATIPAGPNTDVTLKVQLTPATTRGLFERARATGGFRDGCESSAKNIAKTGIKTLTYTSSGTPATCTWNYAEDKNVSAMQRNFEGIAFTLDAGRKIDRQHRYDRLALDPEVQSLFDNVKQGLALEIGTIAPTLHAIADDPQVLERVRAKATKLLALGVIAQ